MEELLKGSELGFSCRKIHQWMSHVHVPTERNPKSNQETLEIFEASESVFTAFLEAQWELCKVEAKHLRKAIRQYFTVRMEVYLQASVLSQVQVNVVFSVLLQG